MSQTSRIKLGRFFAWEDGKLNNCKLTKKFMFHHAPTQKGYGKRLSRGSYIHRLERKTAPVLWTLTLLGTLQVPSNDSCSTPEGVVLAWGMAIWN